MTTLADTNAEEKVAKLIGGVNNLPTPPIVFTQIQKVLNNPKTSAYEIGSILQEDPAISAKVLKMTNSAFYGLSQTVESVKQAVVIVGLEAIKNLVLSASMFKAFSSDQLDLEFQDYFWRHSLATAFAARLLALKPQAEISFDAESGFSAGLLHDIGKMVISVYMADEAAKIKSLRERNPECPEYKVEEAVLGCNHTQIGALLGTQWKLPDKLIEAIKFHHFPQLREDEENNLPYLIHLSNYLAIKTFDVDEESRELPPKGLLAEGVLNSVGISQAKLDSLVQNLHEEYTKAETFMEMAKGG